ncbi:MAG: hypothetical protein QM767_23455 [Anaeromyxobacter sp.]
MVDRLQRGRLEDRQLGTGQAEEVAEVGGELIAAEPADVVAHDDALGRGLRATAMPTRRRSLWPAPTRSRQSRFFESIS